MDDESASEEESPVADLVARAAQGDQDAWNDLVERYSPLLVGVIRQYRLTASQLDDVAQTVWLRLVEHLGDLRQPEALPGWIATTARRESLKMSAAERRLSPYSPLEGVQPVADGTEPDVELLRAERHQALLAGLAELPGRQRNLLLLLVNDPPLSYQEISERSGIPVGSIGPTRSRALERLRRTQLIQQFTDRPLELEKDRR